MIAPQSESVVLVMRRFFGQLYDILDGIREINPDGLHTIEAPPFGNCTLSQAREVLGDMILIRNIQYSDLGA